MTATQFTETTKPAGAGAGGGAFTTTKPHAFGKDIPASYFAEQWRKSIEALSGDFIAHTKAACTTAAIGEDWQAITNRVGNDGCYCCDGIPGKVCTLSDSSLDLAFGAGAYNGVVIETCFAKICRALGVKIDADYTRIRQLDSTQLASLLKVADKKVVFTVYSSDDKRNHVELVSGDTQNARVAVKPLTGRAYDRYTFVCTSLQEFFNFGNAWADVDFYSQAGDFGGGLSTQSGAAQARPNIPASVVDESAAGGGSNVTGGVQRSKKRTIGAKSTALAGPVLKNYRTSNAVMFNNADELFQDKISREHAQEVVEELFEVWGVPLDQPEAVKYAEDMLWTFLIAVTASNKADYNRIYDIPVKPLERNGDTVSTVDADFSKFSLLLTSKFGITRRQFARGVADDLRAFLKVEENQPLLEPLAIRVGCEPLMAYLAFDGSTHCTNMTTREINFTKTLESRNLFERDDETARGASERLMQGMSGGVRSVAPR